MKGLAIASLILGIIGFLCSFWFGLGILPSILAVGLGIFPSLKRGNRAMAITGLVLGLLGTLISVSIISHPEPYLRAMLGLPERKEHIQKQTTKEIIQEEEKKPTKEATQDIEAKPAEEPTQNIWGKPKEEITQEEEKKPVETAIKLGEGIRMGELLITFEYARIIKTYAKGNYFTLTPKSGYKFVVVKVTGKYIGKKKSFVLISGKDIEVDNGYIYDSKYQDAAFNLLPEEAGSGELVFEILEKTIPVKLNAFISAQQFTVDVAGAEESSGVSTKETSAVFSTPSGSKGKEPVKKILRRDCESPDGNTVFKNVREGMCPEGYKEVLRYENIR